MKNNIIGFIHYQNTFIFLTTKTKKEFRKILHLSFARGTTKQLHVADVLILEALHAKAFKLIVYMQIILCQ